jgi:hypothetical protein
MSEKQGFAFEIKKPVSFPGSPDPTPTPNQEHFKDI